jgi:hypothetical protein
MKEFKSEVKINNDHKKLKRLKKGNKEVLIENSDSISPWKFNEDKNTQKEVKNFFHIQLQTSGTQKLFLQLSLLFTPYKLIIKISLKYVCFTHFD